MLQNYYKLNYVFNPLFKYSKIACSMYLTIFHVIIVQIYILCTDVFSIKSLVGDPKWTNTKKVFNGVFLRCDSCAQKMRPEFLPPTLGAK